MATRGAGLSRVTRIALGATVVAVVVVAFAALFVDPPTGDDEDDQIPDVAVELVAPEVWVAEVCPVLATLNQDLSTIDREQPSSVESEADRAELQAYFAALFDEGMAETEEAARAVADAGAPDSVGGRNRAESLRRALLSARADLATGAAAAAGLDPGDAAAFQTDLVEVATTLQSALSPLSQALLDLQADPTLGPIVADQPGCSPG